MNRVLRFLISLGLVFTFTSTLAPAFSNEDEQWLTPDRYEPGFQGILISDVVNSFQLYSRLQASTNLPAPGSEHLCSSVEDSECAQASSFYYNAILPVCSSIADTDCISGLKASKSSGEYVSARFNSYIYPNHVNRFVGSPKYSIPNASEPSIWEIPEMPHLGGNLYAVVSSVQGNTSPSFPRPYDNLNAFIIPVERVSTGAPLENAPRDGFKYSYPQCINKIDSNSGRGAIGCRGMQDTGLGPNRVKCALLINDGTDCYVQRPFPDGIRLQLSLKLGAGINGWLHGRLSDPEISIKSDPNGNALVQIAASPVKVPIFYFGDKYENLPPKLQQAYAEKSNLSAGGGYGRICCEYNPDPLKRNSTSTPWSWGQDSMKEMSLWLDVAGNKSVAAPSTWSIHTLTGPQLSLNSACSKQNSLNGLVTTNATTYADGPPVFSEDSFQYQVASPHFSPNGETFLGNYNLVINSEVARCIYGFSNAPVSAKIEIINDESSQFVATTTFKEANGWIYLQAAGFTFSQPTIKITLKQESQVTQTQKITSKKTIRCVRGKSLKLLTSKSPKCPSGYRLKAN